MLTIIVLFGISTTKLSLKKKENRGSIFNSRSSKVYVEIYSIKETNNSYILNGEIIQIVDEIETELNGNNLLIFLPKEYYNNKIIPGGRMWIHGQLREITSGIFPHSFDWQRFYSLKSIFYQLNIESDKHLKVVRNDKYSLNELAFKMRSSLKKKINKLFVKQESIEILKAIILGDKGGMHDDVRSAFSKSGVMHVLAVSGLHVGIIYLMLNSVLLFFFKSSKGLVFFSVLIAGIWLYALITGLASSVIRASFMFSLIALGRSLNRRSDIYNTLACSAFFILCINPLRLFDLGFQLSYSAVVGIVSIYPILDQLFNSKYWLIQKIWSSLSVSVAAQIGTLPLILYYFKIFPVYFFLSNLIAIPAVAFFIISGFVVISFSYINSLGWIVENMSTILDHLVYYLYLVLHQISNMPLATMVVSIDEWEIIFVYAIIFLLIFSLYTARKKVLIFCLFLTIFFPAQHKIRNQFSTNTDKLYLVNVNNNLYFGGNEHGHHTIIPLFSQAIDMNLLDKKINNYWLENNLSNPDLDTSHFINPLPVNSCVKLSYSDVKIALIYADVSGLIFSSNNMFSDADLIILTGKYNKTLMQEIKQNREALVLSYNMTNYSYKQLKSFSDENNMGIQRLKYNDFREYRLSSF